MIYDSHYLQSQICGLNNIERVQFNWSDPRFVLQRSSTRVSQTSWPLETYMVVNFRTCEISQSARKLTRTPTLIYMCVCARTHNTVYPLTFYYEYIVQKFSFLFYFGPQSCFYVIASFLAKLRTIELNLLTNDKIKRYRTKIKKTP